jgi:hypothetical protein
MVDLTKPAADTLEFLCWKHNIPMEWLEPFGKVYQLAQIKKVSYYFMDKCLEAGLPKPVIRRIIELVCYKYGIQDHANMRRYIPEELLDRRGSGWTPSHAASYARRYFNKK